jgi:DNA-binding IclR family transcriptional regulator
MSTIRSGGKILKVLKALTGHSLKGATVSDLSKRLNENAAQIHRALQTLVSEGLATQMDDGSYALGREIVAIAHAHSDEINRAQSHIAEHVQRVTARAHQIKEG